MLPLNKKLQETLDELTFFHLQEPTLTHLL